MQRQFIPYEKALALKDLGFGEQCFAWYNINVELLSDVIIGYEDKDFFYTPQDMDKIGECIAPTFSQAFRWFREHYLLFSSINADQTMEPKFCYSISRYESTQFFEGWENIVYNSDLYYTYEEAELACLKKLIEILKNQ